MTIKAILFDKDGVLVDTEKHNVESAKYALKKLGVDFTQEDIESINGRNGKYMGKYFFEKYGTSVEEFRDLKKVKSDELKKDLQVFEGTISFLKECFENGLKIGLVTSGYRETTMELLHKLDIVNYFSAIITSDECVNTKPHPEPYENMLKLLDIDAGEALVVEDSKFGLQSAKSAGIKTIFFNSSSIELDKSKYDFLVETDTDFGYVELIGK